FDKVTDDDWQSSFELNLLSFVRTIREVTPYMREAGGGRIINFASSSIKQPIDDLILSNTFRAVIVVLSKSLSQELASEGIVMNTSGLGSIATDQLNQINEAEAERL